MPTLQTFSESRAKSCFRIQRQSKSSLSKQFHSSRRLAKQRAVAFQKVRQLWAVATDTERGTDDGQKAKSVESVEEVDYVVVGSGIGGACLKGIISLVHKL